MGAVHWVSFDGGMRRDTVLVPVLSHLPGLDSLPAVWKGGLQSCGVNLSGGIKIEQNSRHGTKHDSSSRWL